MQVSCSNCGAQYEFDASAIPESGYDAQCTTCNAVFFVHPDPEQAKTAAPARAPLGADQVVISCQHCGAVYQFSASDIPPGGYDAQCTQCQGIFFVSPDNAAKVAGAVATPAQAAAQTSTQTPEVTTPVAAAGIEPPIITETADIPIVDEKDFASMSQVVAMEKLQADVTSPSAQTEEPITAVFTADALAKDAQGVATPEGHASLDTAPSPFAQAADFAKLAEPLAPGVVEHDPAATDAAGPEPSTTQAAAPESPEPPPGFLAPAEDASDATYFGAHPETTAASAAPLSAPQTSQAPQAQAQTPTQAGVAAAWTPSQLPQPDEEDLRPAPQDSRGNDANLPPIAAPGARTGLTHPNAEHADVSNTHTEASPHVFKRRWRRYAVAFGVLGALVTLGLSQQHQLARLLKQAEKAAQPELPPLEAEAVTATQQVVSPAAQKAFERGMLRLVEDTNQGFADALDAFEEALKQDPTMVDAYAGMALQALLSGQDAWAQGQSAWTRAKELEANLNLRQPKILALAKARQNRELERERARYAEDNANLTKLRETAMLHLQMGKTWHTHGLLILMRGSRAGLATPLLQATSTLWAASDPYLTVAGEADHSLDAANALLNSAQQSIANASAQGSDVLASSQEPWAPMWLALAQARILAASPATTEQAIQALQKAAQKYPKLNRSLWEQSVLLAQAGQKAPAKKTLEALLKQCPDHDKARALLASLPQDSAPVAASKKARKTPPRHKARRR